MTDSPFSPSEEDFLPAVHQLRESHPALSIPKLLQQLKLDHPSWLVSDKRLRKTVQALAVPSSRPSNGGDTEVEESALVAKTGLDGTVDAAAIAPKVKVKMFGGGKGKGLVAREKVQMGEVLWQEEPWLVTSSPGLWQHIHDHRMCAHCFALFSRPSPPLSVACVHCDTVTFCNRICMGKSTFTASHHPLLCPGQNRGAVALLNVTRELGSRMIQGVSRIVAKWVGERAWEDEQRANATQRRVWSGMARVDQRVKEMERKEWEYVGEARLREWTRAHAALVSALNPAPTDDNYKPFQKLLARGPRRAKPSPLTAEEEQQWFSFDSFLQMLGLVGLNQEDSGGCYALHAHLNHSCDPHLQARNLPKSFTLPSLADLPCDPPPPLDPGVRGTNKLTILARRLVHPGEELTISYVNLKLPRSARRQALRQQYGFWCNCARCLREEGNEESNAAED